jgi:ATP/maltotriose-dependent transcriptional regulator MalT
MEYRRAREQAERIGDVRNGCMGRINEASAAALLGLYAEADALLREAAVAVERFDMGALTVMLHNNQAEVLEGLGNLDGARTAAERAIELAWSQGNSRMAGYSRVYLARTLLAADRIEEAERAARTSCAELAEQPTLIGHAKAILARVLLARGAIGEAAVVAEQAVLDIGKIEEGEATIRLVHAETLAASGQIDRARVALCAAKDRLVERASKIRDVAAAESFLHAVRDNARTLELALAWGL